MGKLIINHKDLAEIRRRAAELEAARIQGSDSSGSVPRPVLAMPAPITEAERFSAAVLEMPANVRWFFEREEPVPAWRRELEEERAERKRLTARAAGAAASF